MKTFVVALMIFVVVGCAEKVPYSSKVRDDYSLTDKELRELQFHLVNDIVLTKSTKENTTILANGEIVVSESKSEDKVIFKSGIKGVFVKSIEDKIAISFEKDDEHYLLFGTKENRNMFTLHANEWIAQGRGKITYFGETYYCSAESAKAYVTVKLRKSNRNSVNQRLAKGRKI
jgi:ABC-type uncharacterized transport system auxiliary subunit